MNNCFHVFKSRSCPRQASGYHHHLALAGVSRGSLFLIAPEIEAADRPGEGLEVKRDHHKNEIDMAVVVAVVGDDGH